jgi:hypothetical protein
MNTYPDHTTPPSILINLAHPLTEAQLADIAALLGHTPEVRALPVQTDRLHPLAEVACALVDQVGLTADAWQTLPLLLNPPGLAPLALAVIAELHGRCGYFLPILNLRPVAGALPPRYEVAEIINLHHLREQARVRRAREAADG